MTKRYMLAREITKAISDGELSPQHTKKSIKMRRSIFNAHQRLE